jgi:hypothetical protein
MQKPCFTIKPYCESNLWFFDDPTVGLTREGLTDGTPEVLLRACDLKNIGPNFVVRFSDTNFGFNRLDIIGPVLLGTQYYWAEQNMICWFCPALLKYFPVPPAQIYFCVFNARKRFSSSSVRSNLSSGRNSSTDLSPKANSLFLKATK